jgi:DNA-binding transcriptional regulator YiaG
MKRQAGAPAQRKDPAVESLIFWRQTRGLSQAQTVAFFRAHLFDLTLATLKSWESGRTAPRANTQELLTLFLEQHPNPKGEC